MPDAVILDRWWAAWVALFPAGPAWNPYGASIILALAMIVAFRTLKLVRSWFVGNAKRPIDFGLDE